MYGKYHYFIISHMHKEYQAPSSSKEGPHEVTPIYSFDLTSTVRGMVSFPLPVAFCPFPKE